MEQDTLKSVWQSIINERKNSKDIKSMMSEATHPVMRRLRKQMIIEAIAFSAFLFVYYDFFDGDRKPLYLNILLVAAMLLIIVHNVMVYLATRRGIKGNTIRESLQSHLYKMKLHAVLSVVGRVLLAGCFLVFFSSTVVFNVNKYWILAAMVLVFAIQIVLLSRVWMKRLMTMKKITQEFSSIL